MQTLLIFLLFAAALAYLGWRGYRSLFARQAGCGKGCGCETTPTKKMAA